MKTYLHNFTFTIIIIFSFLTVNANEVDYNAGYDAGYDAGKKTHCGSSTVGNIVQGSTDIPSMGGGTMGFTFENGGGTIGKTSVKSEENTEIHRTIKKLLKKSNLEEMKKSEIMKDKKTINIDK